MISAHKKSFVLFGGLTGGKYPEFIKSIKDRDLNILILDDCSPKNEKRLDLWKTNNLDAADPIAKACDIFLEGPDCKESILFKITEWSQQHEICGIYNIRESFVEVAGWVADYLNLDGPGLKASQVCRNKFLQRTYLSECSPLNKVVFPVHRQNEATLWQEFPMVVKPLNRQASSGVILPCPIEAVRI